MRMPLPSFSWANGSEVWNCMLEKDAAYSKRRNERMLERHPLLLVSYRTILVDWLSEVSYEHQFHRETYHLAVDFVDRFLTAQTNINKLQLQLIGITCLFLAAKYEEVKPPAVHELAELTDGACRPEDIIDNEVVILSAINWDITPLTPNAWLNTYMQILLNLDDLDEHHQQHNASDNNSTSDLPRPLKSATSGNRPFASPMVDENSGSCDRNLRALAATISNTTKNDSFILPANNGFIRSNHKRIASVIDLALLHIESLRYSYSILTASALYYFTSEATVRRCTGYKYQELAACVRWLQPFAETIKEIDEPVFLSCSRADTSPHSAQKHTYIASAKLLDKVHLKMEDNARTSLKRRFISLDAAEDSDDTASLSPSKPTILLTPPRSARKSRRVQ